MTEFGTSRTPGDAGDVPGAAGRDAVDAERSSLVGQLFTIPSRWHLPASRFGLVLYIIEHNAVVLFGRGDRSHATDEPGEVRVSPSRDNGLICAVRFEGTPRCRPLGEIVRLSQASPVGKLDHGDLGRVRNELEHGVS